MAAKFEISTDKSGKSRFHLKAPTARSSPPARARRPRKVPTRALSRSRRVLAAAKVVDLTEREPAHN